MLSLFKLSYLPYLLIAVGLILIVLWARSNGKNEGFEDIEEDFDDEVDEGFEDVEEEFEEDVDEGFENPLRFNMYYVDWCPHCHHAKPEFEKLGTTMTIGGRSVVLKAIEAEKNPEAVQGVKISGYPTFVLYDAEGNIVKDYDGPRKEAGFRSFLEDSVNMNAQRMN